MFGSRILILVPHPDDEVVACCATIRRVQKEYNASIFSLYLTTGCISKATMWPWQRRHYSKQIEARRLEAEKAAKLLGITPLGWSDRPARHLWRDMTAVAQAVHEVALNHHIDQLWVPAYEGGNADHDALNAIGQIFHPALRVLEFAEYNFNDGIAHSQTFPDPSSDTVVIELSDEERALKKKALRLYHSEQNNLGYIKYEREAFRPLHAYDYAQAPHKGILWYTRFQWVPFRHPRVDFTNPERVSESIRNFLDQR